jgi:low temperature requirement protein LtrA
VCLTYAATTSIAQIGWVVLIGVSLAAPGPIILGAILVLIELSGPLLAERQAGGTPWHPNHIAERYSLLAIIALGEGVVGTVAALSAVVDRQGWTLDALLVGIAGMGLTFGMWWVYYLLPSGKILERHRDRVWVWSYAQVLIVTSIVATGGGLRVAAYLIDGRARITALAALLAVVVPVGVFLGSMHALSYYLVRQFHVFQVWWLIPTAGIIVVTLVAALSGVDVARCLVILMLAPAVTVVASEVRVAEAPLS